MTLTANRNQPSDSRFEDLELYDERGNIIGEWAGRAPVDNIDITMKDLHKYAKEWMIANSSTTAEVALECAINNRWPSMNVGDVLFAAECNQLQEERMNMVRDANNNQSKWIDTTVQGDLFHDMKDRVPRWVIVDGKPVEYWKVSPLEILEYKQSLVASLAVEEKALLDAAATKRQMIVATESDIEKTRQIIEKAKASGIDPSTVRYEKQD